MSYNGQGGLSGTIRNGCNGTLKRSASSKKGPLFIDLDYRIKISVFYKIV